MIDTQPCEPYSRSGNSTFSDRKVDPATIVLELAGVESEQLPNFYAQPHL
jgi:hypothetical protein